MKSTNASTPMVVGVLAIASIIGAAAFVLTQSGSNIQSASQTNTVAQAATKETAAQVSNTVAAASTNTATTNTSNTTTSGYKDGTYSASAGYQVPHGSNTIDLTITMKNGVISALKTSHDYGDRESGMYIDSFDSSIKSVVIGKSLDMSLSRVGGASLTTHGFEDALATIANQAKA